MNPKGIYVHEGKKIRLMSEIVDRVLCSVA